MLTLGGDHSICMGTLAGTAKANRERLGKETAVIYVDAHADINTPESSGSGNIHGMPLAFITGLVSDNNEDTFGWIKDEERVSPKNLVYIGLRYLDKSEKKILSEQDIKAFSMMDVERHGISKVIDMALSWVGSDIPIHLSFDIDSLDPIWGPSTGAPVDGGLTLRESNLIAQSIFETGQLVALNLIEVNPSLEMSGSDDTNGVGDLSHKGCSWFIAALNNKESR